MPSPCCRRSCRACSSVRGFAGWRRLLAASLAPSRASHAWHAGHGRSSRGLSARCRGDATSAAPHARHGASRGRADASGTTAASRSATCRAAPSGPRASAADESASAVMTSRNLLNSTGPRSSRRSSRPEPAPLREVGRDAPRRRTRCSGPSVAGSGQPVTAELHVVARVPVGRDGDAERRLREDQARRALALGVLGVFWSWMSYGPSGSSARATTKRGARHEALSHPEPAAASPARLAASG